MSRLAALAIATLAALATPARAEPVAYTIDPTHTFPGFEISHLGLSVQRGRFNRSGGKLVLDRAAGAGSVEISIDAASVDTGLDELERRLRGDEFFNVETYPQLTFKSDRFVFIDGRLIAVEGMLTLLGVTRPLYLTVDHLHCRPHPLTRREMCGANATANLKRSEFGMDRYVPMVGDEVRLLIQVEANRD